MTNQRLADVVRKKRRRPKKHVLTLAPKRAQRKGNKFEFTVCVCVCMVPLFVPDCAHVQDRVDNAVLDKWYENVYEQSYHVERVYDGPIDGWFFVEWGQPDSKPVTARVTRSSSSRPRPELSKCKCVKCVKPCPEDRVPEAELESTAPEMLREYKESALYQSRVRDMELDAVRRFRE